MILLIPKHLLILLIHLVITNPIINITYSIINITNSSGCFPSIQIQHLYRNQDLNPDVLVCLAFVLSITLFHIINLIHNLVVL